jgi:hypothetical protein
VIDGLIDVPDNPVPVCDHQEIAYVDRHCWGELRLSIPSQTATEMKGSRPFPNLIAPKSRSYLPRLSKGVIGTPARAANN